MNHDWTALATAAALMLTAAPLRAQYDGEWRASPMRVQVSVESWGPDCGPRPQSTSTGGGVTTIAVQGDHLGFRGGMSGQTNGCWTDNQEVRRRSSSVQGGQYRTTCSTAADNSKQERGVHTITVGSDHVSYRGQTQYDWSLNESRCVASIEAMQSLARVSGGDSPEEPSETIGPTSDCTPGGASELSLRPAGMELEPGSRRCFRARLLDSAGCPLETTAIEWTVEPADRRVTVRNGCVSAASELTGEVHYRVIASGSGFRQEAQLVVRATDVSDLVAQRTPQDGATTSEADEASARNAAGLRAEGQSPDRATGWTVTGIIVLIGVIVALVLLLMRRRQTRETAVAEDEWTMHGRKAEGRRPVASAREPNTGFRACPVCHGEFEDVLFCPHDGSRLSKESLPPESTNQGNICPVCHRGYSIDTKRCPRDQEELVPYVMFVAQEKRRAAQSGTRVCPTCGEQYPLTQRFCAKDGAELEVLN